MTSALEQRRDLANRLVTAGAVRSPWLRHAFEETPRERFVPQFYRSESDQQVLVDGTDPQQREQWLRGIYTDEVLTVQLTPAPDLASGAGAPTSSSSMPTVMAGMLEALDLQPGHRVLEIGTGTGYNAALLASRLGADNVTTIEVDAGLAAQARQALRAAGYDLTVVTGDGALGYPPRAPYDRIIATAAVQRVPYPWVAQTRPGGRVITPWGNAYHNGALLSLAVSDDGTAVGRVVGDTAFMWLRGQRVPRARFDDARCADAAAVISYTDLHPYPVVGQYDASLAISLRVGDCANVYCPVDGCPEEYRVAFVDPSSDSWATVHYRPGVAGYQVHQAGPRRLWDEVSAAHRWWLDAGSPAADQWRITVTPQAQLVELA